MDLKMTLIDYMSERRVEATLVDIKFRLKHLVVSQVRSRDVAVAGATYLYGDSNKSRKQQAPFAFILKVICSSSSSSCKRGRKMRLRGHYSTNSVYRRRRCSQRCRAIPPHSSWRPSSRGGYPDERTFRPIVEAAVVGRAVRCTRLIPHLL